MHILFIVRQATLGGHFRSALSLTRAIQELGYEVTLAAGEGEGLALLKGSDCRNFALSIGASGTVALRSVSTLTRFAREEGVQIIHAFDPMSSFIAHLVARKTGIKKVLTIPGGPVPKRLLRSVPVVVYSKELAEGLARIHKYEACEIQVNAARIELDNVPGPDAEKERELKELGIDLSAPIVMMIARIAQDKIRSILFMVETTKHLALLNPEVQFVHFGVTSNPAIRKKVKGAMTECNHATGRPTARLVDYHVLTPSRFYPYASLVAGVGRSALEGMLCQRPTVIVGEQGFAGLVCPETVDKLAYFNFSGRDAVSLPTPIQPAEAAQFILDIISDSDRRNSSGRFGHEWLRCNLDVKVGAARYADLYEGLATGRIPHVLSKSADLGLWIRHFLAPRLLSRTVKERMKQLLYSGQARQQQSAHSKERRHGVAHRPYHW
jgi:hypothetical protein